jgi:uncharacterized protein YndB with AHSA1/START domain
MHAPVIAGGGCPHQHVAHRQGRRNRDRPERGSAGARPGEEKCDPHVHDRIAAPSQRIRMDRVLCDPRHASAAVPADGDACYCSDMSSTRITRRVNAPRAAVYRALVDGRAVATWMVPTGMTSHVHAFDAREGGSFRISLTYNEPTGTGKTSTHTDTFHGRFVRLVPNEQIVEVVEFETAEPALQGEMTITITLADADGGTEVVAVHDGLPSGLSPAENELGWQSSLVKLAALVEAR